jgi:tetratricopeptide (TPR) repeat protein
MRGNRKALAAIVSAAVVSHSLSFALVIAAISAPQQAVGGASAFQGQDIMGGAAIVFKRPQRARDLVGGAAMLIVKRAPRPAPRPTEIARNTGDRRRPRPHPGERPPVTDTTPTIALSDADKAEAFKNQGNTFYDLGQFEQAVDAYKNALKLTPKDPVIHNNLGAAYFGVNKNADAAVAFRKALELKPDDGDAFFNLGIALSAIDKSAEALDSFKQALALLARSRQCDRRHVSRARPLCRRREVL